jgi:hypothetical protein
LKKEIEVNNLVVGTHKSDAFLKFVKIHVLYDTAILMDKRNSERIEKQIDIKGNKTNSPN